MLLEQHKTMTEQISLQQSSASPKQPKDSIIDDLFELTATRNLETMLRKALSMVTRLMAAEAGSILFQAQPPQRVRSGTFRQEALARVQHLEKVISKRLKDTGWRISTQAALPISTSKLGSDQLILINLPLLNDTTVVGSLSMVLPPGQTLNKSRRSVLTRVAKGIGQNASLLSDLSLAEQRLKQMRIFYKVSQVLMTTFDITKLLSDTMQLAADIIDAGAASLMLVDEEKDELVFEVSHGSRSQTLRQLRIPRDEGIAGWVASNGQPVIVNDARTDTRFSHRVDVRTGFLTQSIAAVPLKIKGRISGPISGGLASNPPLIRPNSSFNFEATPKACLLLCGFR